MNLRLAKEIYSTAWHIDPVTFTQYSKMLEFVKNGGESNEPKSNAFGILSNNKIVNSRDIKRDENIKKGSIALYNFDSVITKYGGMSHYGTKEIATQFAKMENNENIVGHIFFIESGGGSANAIKYIRDVTNKSVRQKPLVTYAEDIMASAAMYIASDSDYIIVNSKDAMIGSIGTMIEIEGYKSGSEDKTGKRHLRIYASQSTNKNKEFEQAINEFDVELIQSTILDPHAKQFIKDMEQNRPNITPLQKTGAIFRAEETIGTLIDSIGTFSDAVNKVNELSNNSIHQLNINNNQTSDNMNKSEILAKYPEIYAEIKKEGSDENQKRVEGFLVYAETDIASVKAAIESGNEMTPKFMAEMSQKMTSNIQAQNHQEDNIEGVEQENQDHEQNDLTETERKQDELLARVKKQVKIS